MTDLFLFVSKMEEFEESTCLVTFMELDKVSGNGRRYRFQDASRLIKSLIGSPIRLGVTIFGEHKKGTETRQIGEVKEAWLEGKTVKGKILITAKDIIDKIKQGTKYFLSVGGKAQGLNRLVKGAIELLNPRITHVQIFTIGQENPKDKVGFPTAKIEKLLSVEESVLMVGNWRQTLATLIALDVL